MSKKQRKEETVNNNDAIIKSEETEVSGLEKISLL